MQRIANVLTEATSLALVPLADVKDELGIAGTSQDTRLNRYIAQASARAHSFCDRIFPAQEYSNLFRQDRDGMEFGAPLILSEKPALDIYSVKENGVTL